MERQDGFVTINDAVTSFNDYLRDSGHQKNSVYTYVTNLRRLYKELSPNKKDDKHDAMQDGFYVPTPDVVSDCIMSIDNANTRRGISNSMKMFIEYLKSIKYLEKYDYKDIKVKIDTGNDDRDYLSRKQIFDIAKHSTTAKGKVTPMLCFEGILTYDSLSAIREIDYNRENSTLKCYYNGTRKKVKTVIHLSKETEEALIEAFDEMNDYVKYVNANQLELRLDLRQCDYLYQSKTSVNPTSTAVKAVFKQVARDYCKKKKFDKEKTVDFLSFFTCGRIKESGKVYAIALYNSVKNPKLIQMQYGDVGASSWKRAAKYVNAIYPGGVKEQ